MPVRSKGYCLGFGDAVVTAALFIEQHSNDLYGKAAEPWLRQLADDVRKIVPDGVLLVSGVDGDFEKFMESYPKREGTDPRKAAFEKYNAIIKHRRATVEELLDGARRYAIQVRGENPKYTLMARTWLFQERWKDVEWKRRQPSIMDLAARIES